MATTPNPTPEEMEAANEVLRRGNAAAAAAKRAETRELIAPFLEAGLGSTAEDGPIKAAIKVLREKAMTMQPVDSNLPNSFFVTATSLENADDKIRSLAAMSAEPST